MNMLPATTPRPIMEISDLRVGRDGRTILEIPSLQIWPNEVLVIMGPNGSGKTTLVLCLALLLKPAAGSILYRGQAISASPSALPWRRRQAVVFQEPLLLSTTVWDNVSLGLRLRGVSKPEVEERTAKWLERFGIASLARRQAKTLSGGEAQRASLARAFALQPEILFLDEPFAALDAPTRQALIEDFQKALADTATTVVMVTHDRSEALALATRAAVLIGGRLRQTGSPQEVFSTPADEEIASFVGVENIWPGVVGSQSQGIATVAVGRQQIDAVSDLPAAGKVTVCVRPEDITITVASQREPTSARNKLPGRISKISRLSSQVRITVDCGFPVVALITLRSCEELELGIGREVAVSFKASSVYLLPAVAPKAPSP